MCSSRLLTAVVLALLVDVRDLGSHFLYLPFVLLSVLFSGRLTCARLLGGCEAYFLRWSGC